MISKFTLDFHRFEFWREFYLFTFLARMNIFPGAAFRNKERINLRQERKIMKSICQSLFKIATRNMSSRPYTVIVEGNIGSGKTTFLKPFERHKGIVEVCPEPVEKWRDLQGHNLLQKMYQDPTRYSLLLQTYIQLTMVQEHSKPKTAPIKIMERSLLRREFLNLLFDD